MKKVHIFWFVSLAFLATTMLLSSCGYTVLLGPYDQATITNSCGSNGRGSGDWPVVKRDTHGNLFISCGRGDNDK